MKSIDEIIDTSRPLKQNQSNVKTRKICIKCNGLGLIFEFGHVKNGKCFNCNGRGWFPNLIINP